MAERKANTEAKTKKTVSDESPVTTFESTDYDVDNINFDAKVTVKNLAGWDITFARLHEGVGDVVIVANGQTRLSRNEISAQVYNNNKLFTGTDGQGSHATIIIEDAPTRKWLGFDNEDHNQKVFSDKLVSDLFKMNQGAYEKAVYENIRTRAEKYAFMESIKKQKLNDYSKIIFASNYTGYRI